MDAARREWTAEVTALALERFERRLTEEVAGVRVSMAQCESGLRLEIGKLREELRKEMADLRFDLLKWSFAFWIGQVIAVAGIMGLMLRFTR